MKRRFNVSPKTKVTAAETGASEDAFNDALDTVESDFDYALDGLQKLYDDGYPADAKEIAEKLKADIDNAVSSISAILAE